MIFQKNVKVEKNLDFGVDKLGKKSRMPQPDFTGRENKKGKKRK